MVFRRLSREGAARLANRAAPTWAAPPTPTSSHRPSSRQWASRTVSFEGAEKGGAGDYPGSRPPRLFAGGGEGAARHRGLKVDVDRRVEVTGGDVERDRLCLPLAVDDCRGRDGVASRQQLDRVAHGAVLAVILEGHTRRVRVGRVSDKRQVARV